MTEKLLQYTNLTQVLVFITFLTVLFKYNRSNTIDRILLMILVVSLWNEIVTYLLLIMNGITSVMYTINVTLHHCLWLFLLSKIAHFRSVIMYVMAGYIAFAVFNITLIEGRNVFNYNTFIAGAMAYLTFFLIESFHQLKQENLHFFTHRNYLLLCAPLLLFICLSFIFGFKSTTLSNSVVFGTMPLYTAIGYFANLVYYTIIIAYILRPKTHSNGI